MSMSLIRFMVRFAHTSLLDMYTNLAQDEPEEKREDLREAIAVAESLAVMLDDIETNSKNQAYQGKTERSEKGKAAVELVAESIRAQKKVKEAEHAKN